MKRRTFPGESVIVRVAYDDKDTGELRIELFDSEGLHVVVLDDSEVAKLADLIGGKKKGSH